MRNPFDEFQQSDRDLRARQHAMAMLCLMRGGGKFSEAIEIAKTIRAPKAVVEYLRAPVPAHSTTSGGAEALGQPDLMGAFMASLASNGAFDRMLPDMQPGKAHSQFGLLILNPSAATRLEGRSARATLAVLNGATMDEREVSAIIVMTRELMKHGRGVEVLETALRVAAATAVDGVFLAAVASAATALTPSGFDARGIYEDLRAGLGALATDAASKVHVAMSPTLAKRLSAVSDDAGQRAFPQMTLAGGQLCGLPCTASDSAGTDVLLIDAAGYVGDAEPAEITPSDAATIKLADVTTMASHDGASPPAPVEANVVSLFQTHSTAMRVARRFAFHPMRAASVKLTAAQSKWGLVGSPPV